MRKIAIKEMAYFICQTGDLTMELFSNHDQQVGKSIHNSWQAKYNSQSKKEYYISSIINFNQEDILLHGFIDGVLLENDEIIIEEIKSTTLDLDAITQEVQLAHLAQNKIYAYLYMVNNNMKVIKTRLTYISVVDFEHKSFDTLFKLDDLESFVFDILEKYLEWLNLLDKAYENKIKTIDQIKFPFPKLRDGQRTLMKGVYQTFKTESILYAIAPTGIGKTMATIFSGLKTLGKNDKLFYLTAKGSGKNAPIEALKILSNQGLKVKAIDITAKKKACNLGASYCNPDECKFALGYYDRLAEATKYIYEKYDIFDYDTILETANNYSLCAFEFSLYLACFCDVIIGDYNYVFDPRAELISYFSESNYEIKVLVDEAHNLTTRSKEMFSSTFNSIDIRTIRKYLTGLRPSVREECNIVVNMLDNYRDKIREDAPYVSIDLDRDLVVAVSSLISKCDQVFNENKKIDNKDIIYDAYFKLVEYKMVADIYSEAHRSLVKLINDEIEVDLLCLDASQYILSTIKGTIKGITFFSATLYPMEYHANLLTKGEGKVLELESPFPKENLDIIINNSISTKYKNRSISIDEIIESIETLVSSNKGNYIVFFPSYQYLNMVCDLIIDPNYDLIKQTNNLTDKERINIINKFKDTTKSHVGFFVMGGVFSEGIDYIGDMLNGVIIVGVGLPMICFENNILKDYFNIKYGKGFDYAYTYPGITKVIQAVGRVIRSETDRGVALLLDERFDYPIYHKLFPKHWTNKKVIKSNYSLKLELKNFYNKIK